jgi:hypothetical protein
MKNWKAILGVLLVFLLGCAAGGLGTAIVIHKRVQRVVLGGPKVIDEMILKRLTHQLSLNTDQQEKIKSALEEARMQIRDVRRVTQPQVVKVFADSRDKIRTVLTPDQQKKFDEIVEKNKGRLQAM